MTRKSAINKAACRRLAVEVRSELGLESGDPLDPWKLAEEYGVRVVRLSDLPLSPHASTHFTSVRAEVFSGALLPVGSGAVIIENDVHELVRRRSTMGHEMAHVLCEHRFTSRLVNERGCRVTDDSQEAEATEVGAELLLPFEAAKRLARRGATDGEVAQQFEVSVQFARWRMDATGARLIARRTAALYRRGRNV